jgi:hypothetical protein
MNPVTTQPPNRKRPPSGWRRTEGQKVTDAAIKTVCNVSPDTSKGNPEFHRAIVLPTGNTAWWVYDTATALAYAMWGDLDLPSTQATPTVLGSICVAPGSRFALILIFSGYSDPAENGMSCFVSADNTGLAILAAALGIAFQQEARK